MTIDFDLTFVLQMVVFAALIVVLGPLLFNPVLRLFEERERRTDGAKTSARQMQEEAGELAARYETELEKVHDVARQERDRVRSETAKVEAELMEVTRRAVDEIVVDGRAKIEKERQRLGFELGQQSERLARVLAESVLGRSLH